MGFMDNFTSDSPVTVKQPDYYEMVKEAAKKEPNRIPGNGSNSIN